jgi:hypothetical protein
MVRSAIQPVGLERDQGLRWRCTRPARATRHGRSALPVRLKFAPAPAPIRISILRRDPQRPYSLIRPHHVCSEPRHFCLLVGVHHIAIPAFRSPELSRAPGITSCLENILLLNGGVPRPYPPCRQSRLFQESLQRQPSCSRKCLGQRMEGGPTIARGPMRLMDER